MLPPSKFVAHLEKRTVKWIFSSNNKDVSGGGGASKSPPILRNEPPAKPAKLPSLLKELCLIKVPVSGLLTATSNGISTPPPSALANPLADATACSLEVASM